MSNLPPSQLHDWLREHHSTVSNEALARDGVNINARQRRELVEAGTLERVLHGAYHFPGAPLDELGRCAAVTTCRNRLVIAGPTAGRIWGLRRAPRDGLIHVIAPPASQPSTVPWLKAYRTNRLFDDEIVERDDGIRLTTVARTVVDHARFLSPIDLSSMIEFALAEGRCTLATLRRTGKRLATPGRPWAREFLEVLGDRLAGAPAESDWETKVGNALKRRAVAGLQRQHWLEAPGYGPLRFDVCIPDIRWAVEIDVHPWHRTRTGGQSDKKRDAACRRIHWVVERIEEAELEASFDDEIGRLCAAIELRRREYEALGSAGLVPSASAPGSTGRNPAR